MILGLLVALTGGLSAGPALPRMAWGDEPGGRAPVAHDLHLTHTRMVIEGRTVACRIRVFHDDLQAALQQFARQPGLRLTREARGDSLFTGYLAQTLKLEADGAPVRLQVTASGAETDPAAQEVYWFVVEGVAARPVTRLTVLSGLMFELFRDQQNIVQLLRLPGDTRRTLYFAATDPREQTLEFRD